MTMFYIKQDVVHVVGVICTIILYDIFILTQPREFCVHSYILLFLYLETIEKNCGVDLFLFSL